MRTTNVQAWSAISTRFSTYGEIISSCVGWESCWVLEVSSSRGHGSLTHDDALVAFIHVHDVIVRAHDPHTLAGSTTSAPDAFLGGLDDIVTTLSIFKPYL